MQILSPAGNMESAIYAIQNGCDSIYFGHKKYSARASASNFDDESMVELINYAKLRGVRTYLTLNIILKNSELKDCFEIAKNAYLNGVDGIIVQDIGFSKLLIKAFPDLDVVCSTQMTINNLDGVNFAKKQGFKRVVLSRELHYEEIDYISKNSDIEIEIFGHGALCIGLSGQCSFSSLLGGRSANRGKCARPCRMKYSLVQKDNSDHEKVLDNGYLLSTKDIMTIDLLPKLESSNIASLKIEGRLKSPIYSGTTAKIYKKYIKCAKNNESNYYVDQKDKEELLQVYNRGNSGLGHLKTNDIIYPKKPNNIGIYLGKIQNYKSNRYIELKLDTDIAIGDQISIDGVDGSYTISELINKNINLKNAKKGQLVSIGRIKGNIRKSANVYKLSNTENFNKIIQNSKQENRKVPFVIELIVKKGQKVQANVKYIDNKLSIFKDYNKNFEIDLIPDIALNKPVSKIQLIDNFSKTKNSPFYFKTIDITLDDNVFISPISKLNQLRREILDDIENYGKNNIKKTHLQTYINESNKYLDFQLKDKSKTESSDTFDKNKINISLYPKIFNKNINYSDYTNKIKNLYINILDLINKENFNEVINIANNSNLYLVFPNFIRPRFKNVFKNLFNKAIDQINIKGFVLSNLGDFEYFTDQNLLKKYELIANTNFNITNNLSSAFCVENGISKIILNPELDLQTIKSITSSKITNFETIIYGNMDLMYNSYCYLGKSNRCYPECKARCKNKDVRYYLKDNLNNDFEIIPNNMICQTTIYNCKTLSLKPSDINSNSYRVDILHEDKDQINKILDTIISDNRFEGKCFTNGNLNRAI